MNSMLDFAILYAEKFGWFIFPIAPREKKPLFPSAHPEGDPLRGKCRGECGKYGHGLYDATNDIEVLKSWWAGFPNANIGLDCGRSNLAVIDVDGAEAVERWNLIYDSAALHDIRQAVQQSGRGDGFHLIYRQPQEARVKNTAGKIGANIDTRGDGGYIVVAPSIHPTGNAYKWMEGRAPEDGFDEFPTALLPHLIDYEKEIRPDSNSRIASNTSRVLQTIYDRVVAAPQGKRNTTLYNQAFYAARLLKEMQSAQRKPPYSLDEAREVLFMAGSISGLDTNEIKNTIKSAWRVA